MDMLLSNDALTNVDNVTINSIVTKVDGVLSGRLTQEQRSLRLEKGISLRSGLCGDAVSETSEVVAKMNKEEGKNLAFSGIQAMLLVRIFNGELYTAFRRHGYGIIIDNDSNRGWIVDSSIEQFVDRNGDTMVGSDLQVGSDIDSAPSKVCRKLLEDGYVELNIGNLAAYVVLMVRDEIPENYLERVTRKLSSNTGSALETLVYDCLDDPNLTVGDWSEAIKNFETLH